MKPPLTFLFALLISISFGQNPEGKIDPILLEKTAGCAEAEFIVVMSEQADIAPAKGLKKKEEKARYVFEKLRQTAEKSQSGIREFLQNMGIPYRTLFIVNALKVKGDRELLLQVAGRSDVAAVIDNPAIRLERPFAEGNDNNPRTIEWGLEKINADDVWAMGIRGQGVTVGGQDTGYEWTHPALKASYRGYDATTDTADHNYNWHDAIHELSPLNNDSLPDPANNPCGLDSPEPCDDNNHGTHTMGTMVGLDGENEIGVAPEAQWCACRNMERGWGSPFSYLECFQWFLAPTDLNDENPDPERAPHVIANSWYCPPVEGCTPGNFPVMNLAIQNLRLAGTVVVVSAGNSGPSCSSISAPPAMFDAAFAVGATDSEDTIAGFSSRGPVTIDGSMRLKPDLSAPGVGVRSSIRFGGYASFSGTSMAGPHVAGVVALMISANPDLAGQPDLIEDILRQTAVPLTTDQECGGIPGTEVPNHTYGYGRVDALAAVEKALELAQVDATATALPTTFRVYPNPASGSFFVASQNGHSTAILELYSSAGQRLLTESWQNRGIHEVQLPATAAGMVFYRIIADGKVVTGRLVVRGF
ncbi:MAG: peptidase S8 [Saprospirales bacterium]|nr:peptidase S8 [Saprospirales bacterium]